MNDPALEQQLLLARSGELSEPQSRALEARLAQDPVARALAEELDLLSSLPGRTFPQPGVPEFTRALLLREAQKRRTQRHVWRPVVAAAAACAVQAIALALLPGRDAPAPVLVDTMDGTVYDPFAEDSLASSLAALEETLDSIQRGNGTDPSDELNEWAEELLTLETRI